MYRTDNPLSDFHNQDAEDYRLRMSLPVCAGCGEPIYEDYLYDIDGELFCEDCMNEAFRKDAGGYTNDNI